MWYDDDRDIGLDDRGLHRGVRVELLIGAGLRSVYMDWRQAHNFKHSPTHPPHIPQ